MKKSQLDEALSLGFTTQAELKSFEYGFMAGEKYQIEKNLAELSKINEAMEDELAWLDPSWQPRMVHADTKRVV